MAEMKPLVSVIPLKSGHRYEIWYNEFQNYRSLHDPKHELDIDKVLESYIQYLIDLPMRANTITSKLTGLYKMITFKENHYVNKVTAERIKGSLRNHVKNLPPPKKSAVLSDDNCRQFLNAPYDEDLSLLQLKIFDDHVAINVERSKTDQNGVGFDGIVPIEEGNVKMGNILKEYYSKLDTNEEGPLFPLIVENHFCCKSTGEKTIGNWPRRIATYLNLPNADSFTGHCFRRTMASLAAENGATTEELMVQGRWKSASVANQYVHNSLSRRLEISKKTFVCSPKKNVSADAYAIKKKEANSISDELKYVFNDCHFENSTITIQISSQVDVKKSSSFSQEFSKP
ncbi:hypothetical protein WA158_003373 [Blastocystis sp. Blastoise]